MIDAARSALPAPSLIALDWGTSSLRASLVGDDGRVLDTRIEPWGIMQLPHGDFASAYDAITAEWVGYDVRTIAAGMIGSANGWLTAPYCPAPAGADDLAAALTVVPGVSLSIVPGVATYGDRPDVMRGEETQVVGALALHPHLAAHSVVVLPGTHSKWVQVIDGRIRDFTTYMTGELFAVLRDHSILGRLAVAAPDDNAERTEVFARGVLAAQDAPGGLAPLLFSARALVLANRLAANACMEYLSGLLIGDELRCGLLRDGRPAALVGDGALCERYASALQLLGISDVQVMVGAADAGLWSIACRAGLVRTLARVT
ncbi:2-dehydro-3-deoxygalactonokinase [soil metagenome]